MTIDKSHLEPLHFSDLKLFAKSPAHFLAAHGKQRETTRAMRIGTLVDMLLLTDKTPVVWDGERRQGKAWDVFADRYRGTEIYTQPEFDQAMEIASAVRVDDLAIEYLGLDSSEARTQVGMKWRYGDVARETRGADVIHDKRLVDLKVTNCTEPKILQWHARKMLWHAQLADYEEACKQNGIDIGGGCFLVCVEHTSPYCVSVLRVSGHAIDEGKRCISLWTEQYRQCAETGEWPGYTQSVIDMHVDAFEMGEEEDVEDS